MGLHYTLKIDYFKGEVFLHLKSWNLDPIWSKFVFSPKKMSQFTNNYHNENHLPHV